MPDSIFGDLTKAIGSETKAPFTIKIACFLQSAIHFSGKKPPWDYLRYFDAFRAFTEASFDLVTKITVRTICLSSPRTPVSIF